MTGVALTKLDGSAKGGIAVAIAHELGLPVKLVGVGEALDDLRPFDADGLRARARLELQPRPKPCYVSDSRPSSRLRHDVGGRFPR